MLTVAARAVADSALAEQKHPLPQPDDASSSSVSRRRRRPGSHSTVTWQLPGVVHPPGPVAAASSSTAFLSFDSYSVAPLVSSYTRASSTDQPNPFGGNYEARKPAASRKEKEDVFVRASFLADRRTMKHDNGSFSRRRPKCERKLRPSGCHGSRTNERHGECGGDKEGTCWCASIAKCSLHWASS